VAAGRGKGDGEPVSDDHDFDLVVPFLTDDPVFAYGVEFGMLYWRLAREKPETLKDFVHLENQDRVCVMAGRLGYAVVAMEPSGEWLFVHLRRKEP
jgi:hypothetical protein